MAQLYIEADGLCRTIYDETLDLSPLGPLRIERASQVEPTDDGRWTADLKPLGGPTLGPFPLRSQAIHAELAWIEHWFNNLHGELQS